MGRSTPEQKARANRRAILKARYGITQADYTALWTAQEGVCAACGNPEDKVIRGSLSWLAVDHDHKTGKVRGLLCQSCNLALGLLKEDLGRIVGLAGYLAAYQRDSER